MKCNLCKENKAEYECEECGEKSCYECASNSDFECECITPPRIVKIPK